MAPPLRWGFRYLTALGLVVLGLGCSASQPAFCDDLAKWLSADQLASAITSDDQKAADEQVAELQDLAANSPEEIRADLEEIAATMADVVAVGLSEQDSTAEELERERVNRRLGGIAEHTTAVAIWAEQECGIRLD